MPGRIRAEDIEEVRQRADIIEVIGGQTNLKKTGRIFKGLCPFHQEKTPSFTVDPDKRLYHCFGCGVGGDVFTFIREVDALTFGEAAERLAARYGVPLHYEGGEPDRGGSRKQLIAAVKTAADFFSDLLMNSPEAEGARRYLEGRGFSSDDAKAWNLGYSPTARDALYRHLLGKKFTAKQIEDAGLARPNDSGQYIDRFRGRLMFSIADLTGDPIGFGARALGDEQPKYLNSPDTSLYHKGRILFALNRARRRVTSQGEAIVTEGYTDVIALQKVGLENAVATCGTALGDDHLNTLKRFCNRVILAFDADAAGAVASERAFGLHHRLGIEVLVAPIPAGKDPADVALIEGAEAVSTILEESVPLMRFVLEAEVARHRTNTAEGKARAVRAAADLLRWEPSRVARGEHAFWLARRIGVDAADVQREIAEATGASATAVARPVRQPGHVKVEREALALLLAGPNGAELTDEHFTQPEHIVIFRAIHEGGATVIMDRLPDDATRRLAAELALSPTVTQDRLEVFQRLEEFRIRRKIEALRNTLDRFNPSSDEYRQLFEEMMDLEEDRRRMESD